MKNTVQELANAELFQTGDGFMGAPFADSAAGREGGDPRRAIRLRHACLPHRLAPGAGLDPRAIALGARL